MSSAVGFFMRIFQRIIVILKRGLHLLLTLNLVKRERGEGVGNDNRR